MTKKLMALLLAVLMAVSLLPMPAMAGDAQVITDLSGISAGGSYVVDKSVKDIVLSAPLTLDKDVTLELTGQTVTLKLADGESYADALANAQRLGYAEADPTADVEGIDAARKSCILSGLAFGKNVSPDEIHIEGISKVDALDAQFAEAGGMKIKLLGRTLVQSGKRFCFVSPHLVKSSALLAGVTKQNYSIQTCRFFKEKR